MHEIQISTQEKIKYSQVATKKSMIKKKKYSVKVLPVIKSASFKYVA